MHIKSKYSWIKHIDFMIIDLILMIVSFIAAYAIKFRRVNFFGIESWRTMLVLIVVFYILIVMFANPYSGIFHRAYYEDILKTLLVAVYNFILTALLIYLLKIGEHLSREVFILTYIFYFVIAAVINCIWKKLLLSRRVKISTTSENNLFVFADSSNAGKVVTNALASDLALYIIKGICLVDETAAFEAGEKDSGKKKTIKKVPVVNDGFDAAFDYILQNNVEEVLIAVAPSRIGKDIYRRLIDNGIVIHLNVEAMMGLQTEDQLITNVGVYKTLTIGQFRFTPTQMLYLFIKRICDLLIGIIGVILLIPITVFVKIAYLATGDRASIFYTHKRIGYRGKEFTLYKFRTMCPDAEEKLAELLKDEKLKEEWEENQKLDDDPRITKAGKILRKTSIDEFPQMINLLNGTMSLVGPRPLIEGELGEHEGLMLYQQVKPGITGWWACNGRSNIDYRERLELEYYYIKHCSIYLDVLCLMRTLAALIVRRGAK